MCGITSFGNGVVGTTDCDIDYTGFNVETVEYKNISFTVWDCGGQGMCGDCPSVMTYRCVIYVRTVMYR